MLFIICVLALVAQSYGQMVFSEKCPDIKPKNTDYDVKDVLGDWYEVLRRDARYESGNECVYIKYYLDENDVLVEQANSTIRPSGANFVWRGKNHPLEGRPGVYNLEFSEYSRDRSMKATLVDFRKGNYMVLHGCGMDPDGSLAHYVWVWAKTKSLSRHNWSRVAQVVDEKLNLRLEDFKAVDFNNCPPRRDYPN